LFLITYCRKACLPRRSAAATSGALAHPRGQVLKEEQMTAMRVSYAGPNTGQVVPVFEEREVVDVTVCEGGTA
jgi:hypothetical protein